MFEVMLGRLMDSDLPRSSEEYHGLAEGTFIPAITINVRASFALLRSSPVVLSSLIVLPHAWFAELHLLLLGYCLLDFIEEFLEPRL